MEHDLFESKMSFYVWNWQFWSRRDRSEYEWMTTEAKTPLEWEAEMKLWIKGFHWMTSP